jgi:uncharacterized transporter YbjL
MVTMKQVEDAAMIAFGSFFVIGFFILSITFALGSLVLGVGVLKWAWGFLQ